MAIWQVSIARRYNAVEINTFQKNGKVVTKIINWKRAVWEVETSDDQQPKFTLERIPAPYGDDAEDSINIFNAEDTNNIESVELVELTDGDEEYQFSDNFTDEEREELEVILDDEGDYYFEENDWYCDSDTWIWGELTIEPI